MNNSHFEVIDDKNISSEGTEQTVACAKAISKVLDKHKCRIDVIVVLQRNKVIPRIHIIPAEIDNQ